MHAVALELLSIICHFSAMALLIAGTGHARFGEGMRKVFRRETAYATLSAAALAILALVPM